MKRTVVEVLLMSSVWLVTHSEHTLPWSDTENQGFISVVNHGPDHIIEERSAGVWHSEYETIAQGVCTSMAINNEENGYAYAIKRRCNSQYPVSCSQICSARRLAEKSSTNRYRSWRAIGALHVYDPRPSSARSTVSNPHIGLKVLWHPNYHNEGGCGPNYCCCFVQVTDYNANRDM